MRAEGVHVRELWREPGEGKLLRLLTFQARGLGVIRSCDVVYARWHVLDWAHVVMARMFRKPLVLEVNGTADDIVNQNPALRRFVRFLTWMSKHTLRAADHVIVVSPGLKTWVETQAPDLSITFLANGADAELAKHGRPKANPPYAVFVGELARHQGIDTLLAARDHADWPEGLSLVVIGDGALAGEVQAAADGITIDYRGRLAQAEAHDVLARASVSISPQSGRVPRNRYGVTPLKVSESLMLGTPVVASRLPGLETIVANSGAGAVVQPDDPGALARGVRAAAALDEPGREALRLYATNRLSWRSVASDTVRICAGLSRQR